MSCYGKCTDINNDGKDGQIPASCWFQGFGIVHAVVADDVFTLLILSKTVHIYCKLS